MKVLILNVLKDKNLKDAFDRKIESVFFQIKIEKEIVYIESFDQIESITEYSHLIISGSEASVLNEECWFEPLATLIRLFADKNKPILGICFGHQFIAQLYCGQGTVKKAIRPELGWIDLIYKDDRLFEGIDCFKSFALHYDEVIRLDERFDVLASSKHCALQAFRMNSKPIWGVQFHPDFLFEDTNNILSQYRTSDPFFEKNSFSTSIDEQKYEENNKIFFNFVAI